jgi:hypothetical protein
MMFNPTAMPQNAKPAIRTDIIRLYHRRTAMILCDVSSESPVSETPQHGHR